MGHRVKHKNRLRLHHSVGSNMGRLLIILFTPPWQSENTNTVYEFAKAAIAEGHEVTVFCDIDATYNLLKGQLQAGQTTPTGKMTQLVAEGVHLLACRESARVRGIDVKTEFIEGAVESSLGKLAELMERCDRVVAFG